MSEVFNQKRIDRVTSIARTIMDHVGRDGSGHYTIRALEDIDGMPLRELRKQYFSIGVPGNFFEIPYYDMLMVVRVVCMTIESVKNSPHKPDGEISFPVTTKFTEEEEWRILNALPIERPLSKT